MSRPPQTSALSRGTDTILTPVLPDGQLKLLLHHIDMVRHNDLDVPHQAVAVLPQKPVRGRHRNLALVFDPVRP